ncbi:MAG TPA: iron ABC transporter permease [Levilinea sp.]|nr:iron ABC transporter permease [Levilinea sp.]
MIRTIQDMLHDHKRRVGLVMPGHRQHHQFPPLPLLAAAGLVFLPVLVVLSALVTPTPEVWSHLWATILPEMIKNTLVLLLGVGTGALLLGTGLAWLTVAYRFPGQAIFDWLLVLPLAVPTYVMGYVYMTTFDYAGPVQSTLRAWFGSSVWFPEIRSAAGAVLVMILVLYPYVYLLARAAFHEQSESTFDAARAMGHSRLSAFFRLAVPLARPSLAAGTAMVLMEALTDFATVRFFNFPTLSEGVFRVWYGMMDLRAASELAGALMLFALAVIVLERWLRGRARYDQTRGSSPGINRVKLSGWQGWGVAGVCVLMVTGAFLIPVLQLTLWALRDLSQPGALDAYGELARNSLILSGLAALTTIVLSVLVANGVRMSGGKAARVLARLATMGYAVPGAVIGVGILLPLSAFNHALNDLAERWWGVTIGLLLTGSIVGLIYAYVVRFMAVAYGSVESSLDKVTPNISMAARTLGATSRRLLWQIHLPLIAPGLLAGAILVFVDVMKELPVTMILRPFGYDTLSIWVWQMAAEGAWSGAALPALTIVAVGILPVIFLMRVTATPGSLEPEARHHD